MSSAAVLSALAIAGVSGLFIIPRLLDQIGLRRKNFKGEMIPGAYGVYIAFYALLGCAALRVLELSDPRILTLYSVTILVMAALGALDDIFGTRETGGFRGHFKKLLFERKLTTGAAKALVGGAFALAMGAYLSASTTGWLVNSLLIALSANTLNLLDLRPGRALAGFLSGLAVTLAVCGFELSGYWPIAALLLPTLALAPLDVRGRAMMGDTGSNALGAVLGLTFVLDAAMPAKLAVVGFLLALHVFCEKYSLTQLIERNVILKRIDSLLGVR